MLGAFDSFLLSKISEVALDYVTTLTLQFLSAIDWSILGGSLVAAPSLYLSLGVALRVYRYDNLPLWSFTRRQTWNVEDQELDGIPLPGRCQKMCAKATLPNLLTSLGPGSLLIPPATLPNHAAITKYHLP